MASTSLLSVSLSYLLVLLCGTGSLAEGWTSYLGKFLNLIPSISDTSAIRHQLNKEPWFCHHLDCPKYSVIATYDKGLVELREYEPSVWASTRLKGTGYDSAARVGFTRLVEFFSGGNLEGIHVNETVPVKINCSPDPHAPICKRDFTVSFLIPFDLQATPPTPKDERVFIETLPAVRMYVLAFDKWIDEFGLMSQASDLKKELDERELSYNKTMFYSAVYDKPESYTDRHNEVWIPALPSRRTAEERR